MVCQQVGDLAKLYLLELDRTVILSNAIPLSRKRRVPDFSSIEADTRADWRLHRGVRRPDRDY